MTEQLVGRTDRISTIPGLIFGLGFGGFVDGIALHQIAHWHNMGSAVLPPTTMEAMKQSMTWDGYFHVAMLVLSILGVFLLLRDAHRGITLPRAGTFTGQLILWLGAFQSCGRLSRSSPAEPASRPRHADVWCRSTIGYSSASAVED